MNILLCCHLPLDKKLGGAKVYIEAAESYRALGHEVTLIGYDEITPKELHLISEEDKIKNFPQYLKQYIESTNDKFDVIEFEYMYLPFERKQLKTNSILVARSVLLIHHFLETPLPHFRNIRGFVGKILKNKERIRGYKNRINIANLSFDLADFISVPNTLDRDILIKYGFKQDKIIVAPYGFQSKEDTQYSHSNSNEVSFIGTFDNRKGAVEFPQIFQQIKSKVPSATLKLLGTAAMFSDESAVLKKFPKYLRSSIEVIGRFQPEQLNQLLSNSKVGIFPSYIESFGFGALELMAHGLPTPSYRCPGPNMFVPEELLCPLGDENIIAEKVIQLLEDKNFYNEMREKCLKSVKDYDWLSSSRKALELYQLKLNS